MEQYVRGKGDDNLYRAILDRSSVRRYATRPLDTETLAQVHAIIADVKPLLPDNHFEVLVRDVAPEEDLVESLGAYGRIVSPPHYLVPTVVGESHLLMDLGYRVEQIAVRLTALGIGSCYIGSLGREEGVRARFGLGKAARIGAILVFGYPTTSLSGRTFNTGLRWVVGATNKLPAKRIFFQETFDNPTMPPEGVGIPLRELLEAARSAPSATNAQPWRFLWRDGELYLLVKKSNRRYGEGAGAEYRYFDGGICMGNGSLALDALGLVGRWQLFTFGSSGQLVGAGLDLPDCPAHLEPLAKLVFT